jgi:CHAD domain-containing protein
MLDKRASSANAFQLIGLSCLRDLEINRNVILTGDEAEGIHQMRIAVRRLRTSMSIFKDILEPDPQTKVVKTQLKWLISQLAPARDIHVFQTESVEPIAQEQKDEFAELQRTLADRKDKAFAQARKAILSNEYHTDISVMASWLVSGGWLKELDETQAKRLAEPVRDFAQMILTRRTRKVISQSKHLDELDATHRHALRIMIKKLRYSVEFFGGVFPRKTFAKRQKALKALTRLQNSLGKLNDIAVDKAEGVLQLPKSGDFETGYAAGLVAGRKQTEVKPLLAGAMKAAADLRKHRKGVSA